MLDLIIWSWTCLFDTGLVHLMHLVLNQCSTHLMLDWLATGLIGCWTHFQLDFLLSAWLIQCIFLSINATHLSIPLFGLNLSMLDMTCLLLPHLVFATCLTLPLFCCLLSINATHLPLPCSPLPLVSCNLFAASSICSYPCLTWLVCCFLSFSTSSHSPLPLLSTCHFLSPLPILQQCHLFATGGLWVQNGKNECGCWHDFMVLHLWLLFH